MVGKNIAVYGNFQGSFLILRGLFFAFRGQNRPEPRVIFFPLQLSALDRDATFPEISKKRDFFFSSILFFFFFKYFLNIFFLQYDNKYPILN